MAINEHQSTRETLSAGQAMMSAIKRIMICPAAVLLVLHVSSFDSSTRAKVVDTPYATTMTRQPL